MQYNTCNYLNDNFGNRTKRHQSHPLFRRYRLSHYILYHAFWIQSAIFVIRKWTFPTLLGLWELAVCWSEIFCGSKNLCRRTHRSVSTDRLCTLSGVLGADLFAEIFSLKTEKFLLAKVGKLEKIFAVRKFLTGWILVQTKRGLCPGAPCNGLFDVLYDAERCQNS